jgi:general secretion pathway protein L
MRSLPLLRLSQRGVTAVAGWWLTEFLGLFPRRVAAWLMHSGPRRATVALDGSAVILELANDAGRTPAQIEVASSKYSPKVLDEFLRAHRLDRKDVAIGLRIPGDMIFRRRLVFPLEVAHSLQAAAAQDLALNTPFQLAHVYHDQTTVADSGRIVADQWVVPRAAVSDALEPLGENVSHFAFIEAIGSANETLPRPYIDLGTSQARGKPLLRTIALGLVSFAVLISLAAGVIRYSRQESLLTQLAIELPAAAAKARAVNTILESSNVKQALLADLRTNKLRKPGFLDVWEEISQRLPQDSWLTELRLSELPDKGVSQVTMSGFSTAAAQLVGLFDKSALLADLGLAAPISFDAMEQRERFTLQATLRVREPEKRTTP